MAVKRYDVTGRVGRGGVVYPKQIESSAGKYVLFKDIEQSLDFINQIKKHVDRQGKSCSGCEYQNRWSYRCNIFEKTEFEIVMEERCRQCIKLFGK